MLKRLFDIIASILIIIILSPIFLMIAILIKAESQGPVFFLQKRVGFFGKTFMMHKFRSMYVAQQNNSTLTIGEDKRITKVGKYIRKLHLDELCQTINVLLGHMSLVGPRPEFKKYTKHHLKDWDEVLKVRPGITGLASILYSNKEYLMLKRAQDPEAQYIYKILPQKLRLEKFYVKHQSLRFDLYLICRTIRMVLLNSKN